MSRFSERLALRKVATNNHPAGRKAKIELRRRTLHAIGAGEAKVLDAFAGDGEMYRAIWREAASYVGCDLKWYPDERRAYVIDNRRLLRAIDLRAFNVFDFDAYGSPWEQCMILAARRPVEPGECIGLLLTEGSSFNLKLGGMPKALQQLAGVRGHLAGGARHQDRLIDWAIAGLAKKMRCGIEARWQAARKGGAAMRYVGLVLRGL
jgi:hypothetical protein